MVGFQDADIDRIHGPIDSIWVAEVSTEVALAIVAEMVAARYGGDSRVDRR